MMRAAYICADRGVPVFGSKGSSVHVQEILRALLRRGVRVDLFAANVGGSVPPGLEAVQVHALPIAQAAGPLAERAALAANGYLQLALRREGPFDLVYERYSLWSFAAMETARAGGVPGVLEVNAPLIEEQAKYRQLYDRNGAECVAAHVFGAAKRILAVSEGVAAYLDRFGSFASRVRLTPNGVDTERFRPGLDPSRPAASGTYTVGFVGSLKPWHGLETLIEAIAILASTGHRTRLLVVGDGPERSRLIASLEARNIDHMAEITGAVAPRDVPAMLASMDVGVAPYPELEGFYFSPLKVYEYMSSGLPVVASRIGQLRGLIEDGVNGLLCTPGEPRALAAALTRLRDDSIMRNRLGIAARATVLESHTWDSVLARSLEGLLSSNAQAGADAR